MKYLYIGLAAAACVVSGLAGLTAGINLNPTATVSFVPNWGSVGDWVAGIGTLLAVAVALWQTHLLRKAEVENLAVNHKLNARLMIAIVSRGKLPARVISVAFFSAKMDKHLSIKRYVFRGGLDALPRTLDYAEEITLISEAGMLHEIAVNAIENFSDCDDLAISAVTSLGSRFISPLSGEDLARLRELAANPK